MTLATLYDVGARMDRLLRSLFQRLWWRLNAMPSSSRLRMDVASAVGGGTLVGTGSVEHRGVVTTSHKNRQLLAHPGLEHVCSRVRYGFRSKAV